MIGALSFISSVEGKHVSPSLGARLGWVEMVYFVKPFPRSSTEMLFGQTGRRVGALPAHVCLSDWLWCWLSPEQEVNFDSIVVL